LELEPEAAARSLSIVFGETTTAIGNSPFLPGKRPSAEQTIDHADGILYDLQGRKMAHGTSSNSTLHKGIYVRDRQKVIIK